MKAILSSIRIGKKRPNTSSAGLQHWRNVPKINLLAKAKVDYSGKTLYRVALVAIILLGLYLALSRYQQLQDNKDRTLAASSEFANTQRSVSVKQDELNKLKEQVNQLKQQQDTVAQAYESLKSGRMNWDVAFPLIFNSQVAGASLLSVTSKGADRLEIQGTAADGGAIARLQSEFARMASTFELQSMSVDLIEGSYHYVAQVLLKKE